MSVSTPTTRPKHQEFSIYAFGMILALLVAGLGTVYGLGSLCFIWWDGGSVRRTVILLCAIAIALATWYVIDTDRIPMPHSSVIRGA